MKSIKSKNNKNTESSKTNKTKLSKDSALYKLIVDQINKEDNERLIKLANKNAFTRRLSF